MRHFVLAAAMFCLSAPFAHADQVVNLQSPTPYADGAAIAGNIKRECKITEQLPEFVRQYGRDHGIEVHLQSQVSATAPGRVLVLEITDAMSEGNAFIGHRKFATVKGKLYQNGVEIGDFTGRRNSMGGAFAGFKGSCSVLGRTVKALGEDIAVWLTQPARDGLLGDLQ
jgi:hypothetical protein